MLAGSPAALRGYARFRAELRRGTLDRATLERISLAVAEHYGSAPGIALHSRTARSAGLGLDEVAKAREFDSGDPKQAALLRYLKAALEGARRPAGVPARGGPRARLGRRGAARGDRLRVARGLHGDGQRRRRRPDRRIRRGVEDAARGVGCRRDASRTRAQPRSSASCSRAGREPACCPYYHQAVELIGRRWTGAILEILMQGGPLRFSTIAAAVPDLSDRMLSDRLKELESHRLVERTVYPGRPCACSTR